ncbi:MAG: PAS domain S-box protein [Candidatus Acidiferrum sp.]
MLSTSHDSFYLSATTQLLLTVCLATLLWALYARLQRFEFFRWWAWAWTAFAGYLLVGAISLHAGPAWTAKKVLLILVLLVLGFLQPVLLILGGLSWRTGKKPSRRLLWGSLAVALAVSLVCFAFALALRQFPLPSFAVRNAPRTLALACALLFCCFVFWKELWRSRSYAAGMAAIFCLAYAGDQILYCLSFSEMLGAYWNLHLPGPLHTLAHVEYLEYPRLILLDLIETCGICLGMILLLVERYEHTASALEISERRRAGLAVDNASLQLEIQNREQVEAELRRSEEFSRQVVRNCPVAMLVSNWPAQSVVTVNEKFVHLFGYTKKEMPSVADWWPLAYPDPEYRASVRADWQELIKKANERAPGKLAMEARVRCKDGSTRDIEFHVSLVSDLYVVTFVDLTERLEIERALRESESKFRLVVDTVTSPIWMIQENKFVYFNKEFERTTGYSREEIIGMDPWDMVDPDCRAEDFARARARLAGEPVAARCQLTILTKNGGKRWLDFSGALTQFNGKPALLASALDITATRRAEQELKQHVMYMDALVSNLPLGIVIKDENQRVRFCNAAFEQMFLFTQAELQGKNLDEVIAAHDKQEAAQLTEAVQGGGVVHTTARRQRKDGTFIDVELYGVKVVSGESFVGAFAIYQDITERRKSEEKLVTLRNRLVRAQEEERARIARDLHDDAGQRLALLSIDLEQLKQASMKLKSSLTQQLEMLVQAASEITSDVHNVSRRLHPSQVELLGLAAALSNFCKDFAAHNGMEIEFVNSGLSQKPPQDAALCLFRVAQEAIRNVQKHSGTHRALVRLDEVAGSMRLRISDEGEGFDPESPDFTQGLGLLSMEERLHSLGGELFIHSRRGGGTCIEACIPVSATVAYER